MPKKPIKPKCCQWMVGCNGPLTSTWKSCQAKPTFEAHCADWPVAIGWLCAEHAKDFAIVHRLGQIR